MNNRYAIIDIGSNTIRLVIYEFEGIVTYREVENVKIAARLRNYLNERLLLTEEGISLLVKSLKKLLHIAQNDSVTKIEAIATATIRLALNKQEVLERVKEQLHLEIRILSEDEEAYYGYLSVVNSMSIEEAITVDIGGGSTELTYFQQRQLIEKISLPFGALSLKEQFIKMAKPTENELAALTRYIEVQLEQVQWLKGKGVPVIGIGGSARNMARIDAARKLYPLMGLHEYEMTAADIGSVLTYLIELQYRNYKHVEGLSKERTDTILPAIKLLQLIVNKVGAASFILSRKGLREGILFEHLLKPYELSLLPNVCEEGFASLLKDYQIAFNKTEQVTKIAAMIFHEIQKRIAPSLNVEDLKLLKKAATIFYLGQFTDEQKNSAETFQAIAHRTINGWSHRERLKLALIASYKSKSTFKHYAQPFKHWYSYEEITKMRVLGALLKLAYSLALPRQREIEQIELEQREDRYIFHVHASRQNIERQAEAQRQLKHLEKAALENFELVFHVK